jgi:hypothetical protein
MQPDPYMHLQLHEQELDRTLAAKALAAEARRANAQPGAPPSTSRVIARPRRVAATLAALTVVARVFGVGRRAGT